MKFILPVLLFVTSNYSISQTSDTLPQRTISKKYVGKPPHNFERIGPTLEARVIIFGDYIITGFEAVSTKTPSIEELNSLVGTAVKILETSVTGTVIDPITFEIYQIENQRSDDFIYRVFGSDVRVKPTSLPENVSVHKTNNENCYGIADLGNGVLAVPYKGVLLYLKRG